MTEGFVEFGVNGSRLGVRPISGVWEEVFRKVLAAYRRRWWRWCFDRSWQELAWMDAMAQADRAVEWHMRRAKDSTDQSFSRRLACESGPGRGVGRRERALRQGTVGWPFLLG